MSRPRPVLSTDAVTVVDCHGCGRPLLGDRTAALVAADTVKCCGPLPPRPFAHARGYAYCIACYPHEFSDLTRLPCGVERPGDDRDEAAAIWSNMLDNATRALEGD